MIALKSPLPETTVFFLEAMVVKHDFNLFQLGFKVVAVALERLYHGIIIIDAGNPEEFFHDFTDGLLSSMPAC